MGKKNTKQKCCLVVYRAPSDIRQKTTDSLCTRSRLGRYGYLTFWFDGALHSSLRIASSQIYASSMHQFIISVMHMSRKQALHAYCIEWALSIGVVTKANKKASIMSLDSKHTEACFLPNATDSLCLWVAYMPRHQEMAIFVLTTTTTTQPITLPLAHARG